MPASKRKPEDSTEHNPSAEDQFDRLTKVEIAYENDSEYKLVGYLNAPDFDLALTVVMSVIARGCRIKLSAGPACRELVYEEILFHALEPGDSLRYRERQTGEEADQRIERVLRVSVGFRMMNGVTLTKSAVDAGEFEITSYLRVTRPWP